VSGNFTASADINWNFSSEANPNFANTTSVNDVVYSQEGHFLVSVNVQEFGCTETYFDTVHVYPLPTVGFVLPPMEGCDPYTAFFIDTTLSWEPTYYIWDFGDGNISFEQNPTHTYVGVGQYVVSLTVRVDSICSFDTTIIFDDVIQVNPSPVSGITADPLVQSAYTPLFTYYDQASGNISQTIFFDDGASVTDSSEISHSFIYSGWHTTTQIVINEFGCTDTSEILVYVTPETTVYAPNTFTTNGDGMNEVFKIHAYDVAYYHLQIFDRWGVLFFDTEDPNAVWDGTQNGKKCPEDTYVYHIIYDDMAIIRKKIIGHVNLVR
jgi:gliding motility-associated-like protein